MKIFKYISLAIGLFVVASCDENGATSFTSDMAHIAFQSSTAKMDENGESIRIPVTYASLPGSSEVTVHLSISSTGASIPAIESADFTIDKQKLVFSEPGTQYVTITPIDNNEFSGTKTFTISIASTSPTLLESVQNTITISIIDDDHPWSSIIGVYKLQYNTEDGPLDGDDYAEIMASEEDINTLLFDYGLEKPIKINVEKVNDKIQLKIAAYQDMGKYQGYSIRFAKLDIDGEDFDYSTTEPIIGTFVNGKISLEGGAGFPAFKADGSLLTYLAVWLPEITMVRQ